MVGRLKRRAAACRFAVCIAPQTHGGSITRLLSRANPQFPAREVEELVRILRRSEDSSEVLDAAHALRRVCERGDAHQQRAAEAGAAGALLSILNTHAGSEEVQAAAYSALMSMQLDRSIQEQAAASMQAAASRTDAAAPAAPSSGAQPGGQHAANDDDDDVVMAHGVSPEVAGWLRQAAPRPTRSGLVGGAAIMHPCSWVLRLATRWLS
jgi:hypothetical protein